MFLVTDERLRLYSPPVQIIMLGVALVGLFVLFRYTFWEEFQKVFFTDEPREHSDYAGAVLGIANIIVIVITIYRFLIRAAAEVKKKLK